MSDLFKTNLLVVYGWYKVYLTIYDFYISTSSICTNQYSVYKCPITPSFRSSVDVESITIRCTGLFRTMSGFKPNICLWDRLPRFLQSTKMTTPQNFFSWNQSERFPRIITKSNLNLSKWTYVRFTFSPTTSLGQGISTYRVYSSLTSVRDRTT